jgi:hypothetical protein
MIATLWEKHWMELRWLWVLAIFFGAFPAILYATDQHGNTASHPLVFIAMFTLILLIIPPRFAGTGLATSLGIRPRHGSDPSFLFALSLPLRRRALFLYRVVFALFLLETAAVLGLLLGTAAFVHMGGFWQVVGHCAWALLAVVPLYFLDCLLSIRFNEANIMFTHLGCIMGLQFLLPLAGMHVRTVVGRLNSFPSMSFALGAILIAAALAAVTV